MRETHHYLIVICLLLSAIYVSVATDEDNVSMRLVGALLYALAAVGLVLIWAQV